MKSFPQTKLIKSNNNIYLTTPKSTHHHPTNKKPRYLAGLDALLNKESISTAPSYYSACMPQPVSDIGKYQH